jgi:copper chaperone CopZ
MWVKTNMSLGKIKANKKISFSFQTENVSDTFQIVEIITTCGCTDVKWNVDTKSIDVNYKPKPTPEHIKQAFKRNSYTDTKNITIVYLVDGIQKEQVLNFIANVED